MSDRIASNVSIRNVDGEPAPFGLAEFKSESGRIAPNVSIRNADVDPAAFAIPEFKPAVEARSSVAPTDFRMSFDSVGQSFDLCGQLQESRSYVDRMSLPLAEKQLETVGVASWIAGSAQYGTFENGGPEQVRCYVMTITAGDSKQRENWEAQLQILFKTNDRDRIKSFHQLAETKLKLGLDVLHAVTWQADQDKVGYRILVPR